MAQFSALQKLGQGGNAVKNRPLAVGMDVLSDADLFRLKP